MGSTTKRTTSSERSDHNSSAFTSFGVNCEVLSDDHELASGARRTASAALGGQIEQIATGESQFSFELKKGTTRRVDLYLNGKLKEQDLEFDIAFDRFASLLRITVAEYAPNFAFIHAGAVGWKGRGIIFPARSFRGKSALTAALVRLGARYYSDEYAVLDKRGYLRPFPKDLSLRGIKDRFTQVETSVESLGGKAGKLPIPVGLVLVTEYKKRANWGPEVLNPGAAMMEVLQHSVSIRRSPEFVLSAVSSAVSSGLAMKSKRGEADAAAKAILELMETQ